jgi:hypothetical protein
MTSSEFTPFSYQTVTLQDHDSLLVSLPTAPISPSVDATAISLSFQPKLKALKPENPFQDGRWREIL